MQDNSLQTIFELVPDEFLGEVRRWVTLIESTTAEIKKQVTAIYEEAPKTSRKEFAIWVNANHPKFSPYLFTMHDGEDIVPLMYSYHDWSSIEEDSGDEL